jgi:hypothetical protein
MPEPDAAGVRRVRNPYPAWQRLAGELCCWACCRMLMTHIESQRHTCTHCHNHGYVAHEETP